jgi:pilus assembly protein Flp/PilA
VTTNACEEGASSLEYGLIIAAVAGVIIVAVFIFGQVVRDDFKSTCDKFVEQESAVTCPP